MSNPKCCVDRWKEFFDQLDSKMSNDFIDFDEDLYIIVEKVRNASIVCTFVRYGKIFVYILKFLF